MRTKIKRYQAEKFGTSAERSHGRAGFVIVLVVVSLIILVLLGLGMLGVAYGVRHRAIRLKNETIAMMAAEAGYEEAIFWMSQQLDMLTSLQQNTSGTNGALSVADGSCNYEIKLFAFVGSRPVYRVVSNGHSGVFKRSVDVYVVQALSGWDMGKCRVPFGGTETYPVNFADGEIIGMRVHINDLEDSPDLRDIYILGEPRFLDVVTMGESKYTSMGYDKRGYEDNRDYDDLLYLFEGGIHFNQPDCRITDEDTVQRKLDRFRASTASDYNFSDDTGKKPVAAPSSLITNPHPAVQLEFFVEGGVGKVRITNNCTVRGYQRDSNSKTLDFKIKPGTDGEESERYDIYAYHYIPEGGEILTVPVEETYVSQVFGEFESEPGGQIFVDGSVVIGGHDAINSGNQVIKGTMTVVATGNIWVADSVRVDGTHDASNMPAEDNPNVLGLITQGVVKVVDPGMSEYAEGNPNYYPGPPPSVSGHVYAPVAHPESTDPEKIHLRYLSDPMVVEAAITVGGGGWGAENVEWDYYYTTYGGRKEDGGSQDDLIVRGAVIEAMRGVVGRLPNYYYAGDGFVKQYYMDERILEGILPGDIWLRGKYVPAPSGWHDYRY